MMSILQLQYVLEVQKTGSITQAANNLYMNQPNLSKSIKELEESLGILIFHRTPQGVTPTKKGEEFLVQAREIVQKAEALVQFCQQEDRESLFVAAPPASYISTSFVTTINKHFSKADSFSSKYSELSTDDIINGVLSDQYSLGIIRFPEQDQAQMVRFLTQSKLAFSPLFKFSPKLIFSNGNPLVLAKEITPELLAQQTEITIGYKGNGLSPTEFGNAPSKLLQAQDRTNQYLLLQEIPNTYLWGSPAPKKVLEQHGLYQRDMASRTESFFDMVIYLQGRTLTKAEEDFIGEVQKTIAVLR